MKSFWIDIKNGHSIIARRIAWFKTYIIDTRMWYLILIIWHNSLLKLSFQSSGLMSQRSNLNWLWPSWALTLGPTHLNRTALNLASSLSRDVITSQHSSPNFGTLFRLCFLWVPFFLRGNLWLVPDYRCEIQHQKLSPKSFEQLL